MKLAKVMFAAILGSTCFLNLGLAAATSAEPNSNVRETLRQRLDPDLSQIVLALPVGGTLVSRVAAPFDVEAFRRILAEISGLDVVLDTETAVGMWHAENAVQILKIDRWYTRILVQDRRGYSLEEHAMPPDEALLEQARSLLPPMGVLDEEAVNITLRNLGASSQPTSGTVVRARRLARIIYMQRTVGGVPVGGDRLAFTFALDGSFRNLSGRWRRVDYSASSFATTLSRGEFIEVALDAVVAKGIKPADGETIRLGTFFGLDEVSAGLYALRLKGMARMVTAGPGSSRRPRVIEFDI